MTRTATLIGWVAALVVLSPLFNALIAWGWQ